MTEINVIHPDGKVEKKEIITAYKTADGTEINLYATDRKDDSQNRIVGISSKSVEENRHGKIIDMNKWKETKGIMVDDLRGKKDSFEYRIPQENTLVTEDCEREIALRDENYNGLVINFEEYKKNHIKAENQNINPFPTESIIEPIAEVQPSVAPVVEPIANTIPTPQETTIAPSIIKEAPVETNNNVFAFPNAQSNLSVETPSTPTLQENSNGLNVPPTNAFVQQPSETIVNQTVNNTLDTSNVTRYYTDTIHSLISQLKEVTEKSKDITMKYQEIMSKFESTMEEISGKTVNMLEEISLKNQMSIQNFDKSQAILSSQNTEEMTNDLTRAA